MISFFDYDDATRVFAVHNDITNTQLDHSEPIFATYSYTAPQLRFRIQIRVDEIQVRDLTIGNYDDALAYLDGLTRDTAAPTNRPYEQVEARIVVEGLHECFVAATREWIDREDYSIDYAMGQLYEVQRLNVYEQVDIYFQFDQAVAAARQIEHGIVRTYWHDEGNEAYGYTSWAMPPLLATTQDHPDLYENSYVNPVPVTPDAPLLRDLWLELRDLEIDSIIQAMAADAGLADVIAEANWRAAGV